MTNVVSLIKELIRIYSKFKNLKLEKQREIINAALKEFSRNGFDKASTNEIVKNSEISKGSLFNYFISKKELYIYLLDYGVRIIEKLFDEINLNEVDIFNRIGNIGMQKLQIYQECPYIFEFLSSSQVEESKEVKDIIGKRVDNIYNNGLKKMYEDIDYSKFRDDIDIKKSIEILNWTMFGFGEKVIKQIDIFGDSSEFMEKAIKEWEAYADMLRHSFYR